MNIKHLAGASLAAGLAVLPLGSAGATTPPSTPAPGEAPAIPEGRYRTSAATHDEVVAAGVAAGFSDADVSTFLDADGPWATASIELLLADGGWTQYVSVDDGPYDVGWRGTYRIVDEDTVVATDPCGDITYQYVVDGDVLTLDMVDDQCDGGIEELIAQSTIYETAPFMLVAPHSDSSALQPTRYRSTSFVIPFEVDVPGWASPEPATDMPNFLTFESETVDRGIRFLAPVSVFLPGESSPSAVPDDYVAYLLGQEANGVVFTDVEERTVDGQAVTVLTATVDEPLDGSIGCQEDGIEAGDCFGFQPWGILRMAVIDLGDTPLVIWFRDTRGAGDRDLEYATFDAMVASLDFPDA